MLADARLFHFMCIRCERIKEDNKCYKIDKNILHIKIKKARIIYVKKDGVREMKIDSDLYNLNAIELAPKLLGMKLCRRINEKIIKLRITETEAYFGEDDTACHAHKGKTNRTKVLYEKGGIAYIYLCYGIHSLLNIVTGEKDFPQAVLIRGVEGFDGPGKLTKNLNIDRTLNRENLITSKKLWIEDDGYRFNYKTTKRIGIDYATPEYRNKLWRFVKI